MFQQQQGFQMGGGQQQQQQVFEPLEEIKFIPSEYRTLSCDIDFTTGIIALGWDKHNGSINLFSYNTHKHLQTLPDMDYYGRIRLVAPNTFAVGCGSLKDMIAIVKPNLQGGKAQVIPVKHGCDYNGKDFFMEPLPGGTQLVAGFRNFVVIVDHVKGVIVQKYSRDKNTNIKCVCATPDGNFLTGASRWYQGQNEGGYTENDGEVMFWNVKLGTSKLLRPLMVSRCRSTTQGVKSICIHEERKLVIGGSGDSDNEAKISVWGYPQFNHVGDMDWQFPLNAIKSAKCIGPDTICTIGKYVIAGNSQDLWIFNLDTMQKIHKMASISPSQSAGQYDIRLYKQQGLILLGGYKIFKVFEIPLSWFSLQEQQQIQQQKNAAKGPCQSCQSLEAENAKLKKEVADVQKQIEEAKKNAPPQQQQQQPQMQQQQPMGQQQMMGRGNMMQQGGNQMMGRGNMMMGNQQQMMGRQQQMNPMMMQQGGNQMMGRGNMMMGRGGMMNTNMGYQQNNMMGQQNMMNQQQQQQWGGR